MGGFFSNGIFRMADTLKMPKEWQMVQMQKMTKLNLWKLLADEFSGIEVFGLICLSIFVKLQTEYNL